MSASVIHPGFRTLLRLSAVALSLALSALALAGDLPSFRKGVWEFNRTVEGQGAGGKPATLSNKKCTDPTADMKRMNATLPKQGCKITEPSAKGNVYTYSSECLMQGMSMQSKSVLTVQSDSAYTVQVTSSGGGVRARRILTTRAADDSQHGRAGRPARRLELT